MKLIKWDKPSNANVEVVFNEANVSADMGVMNLKLSVDNKLKAIADKNCNGSIETAIKHLVDKVIKDHVELNAVYDVKKAIDIYIDEEYRNIKKRN